MRVSEIMVENPVIVSPDTSIRQIARLMTENSIGSVIVMEDKKLLGIVTERDLVRRVLTTGNDINSTKASDVYSTPVISVFELEEVNAAVDLMKKHRIRRLVVIGRQNEVVGILTSDDIGYNLKRMSEELAIEYIIASRRGRNK